MKTSNIATIAAVLTLALSVGGWAVNVASKMLYWKIVIKL